MKHCGQCREFEPDYLPPKGVCTLHGHVVHPRAVPECPEHDGQQYTSLLVPCSDFARLVTLRLVSALVVMLLAGCSSTSFPNEGAGATIYADAVYGTGSEGGSGAAAGDHSQGGSEPRSGSPGSAGAEVSTGGAGGSAGAAGADGGVLSTAGAETGGLETGGASTGGQETGGQETGGQETGGQETGGTGPGGSLLTGGTETGGSFTGGAETGGEATGGALTATGGAFGLENEVSALIPEGFEAIAGYREQEVPAGGWFEVSFIAVNGNCYQVVAGSTAGSVEVAIAQGATVLASSPGPMLPDCYPWQGATTGLVARARASQFGLVGLLPLQRIQ